MNFITKLIIVLKMDAPDYIIVGGGTASLAVSWGLTNNRKISVLVLEAGLNLSHDPKVLDPTIASSQPLTNDPLYARVNCTVEQIPISDGRMIGGSSAHNGMQYVRGTPDTFNQTAVMAGNIKNPKTGYPLWSYNDLLPIMIHMEHYTPDQTKVNHEQRGTKGRLFSTQEPPVTDPFSMAFMRGMGVGYIDDYNNNYEISPGVYANSIGLAAEQNYVTSDKKMRSGSFNSYLTGIPGFIKPIVDENLTGLRGRKLQVITQAFVSKVIIKHGKAIGVVAIIGDQTRKIYCKKGVIISTGSVYSPGILQRSGIGGKADLKAAGVKTLVDSPHVGRNLQNQYGPNALLANINPNPEPPQFKLNILFTDLAPYCKAGVRTVQSTYLAPGALFFSPTLITALGIGDVPSVSAGGIIMVPKSSGSVMIRTADPFTEPAYVSGNFTDTVNSKEPWKIKDSDAYVAVSYLKKLQDVVKMAGGDSKDILFPPNHCYPKPWGPAPSDELLYMAAKTSTFVTYHPCCTCRIGTSIKNGVVDAHLKVFGVDGLYVCDNSVWPISPRANTAFIAYLAGLKLADILGGKVY